MENKIGIQHLIHKILEGGYFEDRGDKITVYGHNGQHVGNLVISDSQFLCAAGHCIRAINFMGSQCFKNKVPRNLLIHTVQHDYKKTV